MKRKQFIQKYLPLLNRLYNGVHTVYGPYIAKDNRRRIVLYDGKRRITRQYAKLKMEIKLKRRLGYNETVDHKDRDKLNDRYVNLQILNRSKHASKDALKVKILSKHKCSWCGVKLELTRDQRSSNKAGPFCSRSCTGK